VVAGLVEEPGEWPGINIWEPCILKVRRPEGYFRDSKAFPEELELRITRPSQPELTEKEWQSALGAAIETRVNQAKEKFAKSKKKFLGAAQVMASSFRRRARSYEPKWLPKPKVAANEPKARTLMLRVRRSFLAAYSSALTRWRQKMRDAEFPYGTWMLARQHAVNVAEVANPVEALFALATETGGSARAAPA
jgi:hypothetical protein